MASDTPAPVPTVPAATSDIPAHAIKSESCDDHDLATLLRLDGVPASLPAALARAMDILDDSRPLSHPPSLVEPPARVSASFPNAPVPMLAAAAAANVRASAGGGDPMQGLA